MNPIDFLKTIYLGDRYCTKFYISLEDKKVEIHVNNVSRIRSESGIWNYYSDEDIKNGIIVISEVESVREDSSGLKPNDQIYEIIAKEENDKYHFLIECCHVDKDIITHDLQFEIVANDIYLVDPTDLTQKIHE